MIDTQIDAYAEANEDVGQFSPPHEVADLQASLNKSPIYESEEFSESNNAMPEEVSYNIDLFQQEKQSSQQQPDQEMRDESVASNSSSENTSSSVEEEKNLEIPASVINRFFSKKESLTCFLKQQNKATTTNLLDDFIQTYSLSKQQRTDAT